VEDFVFVPFEDGEEQDEKPPPKPKKMEAKRESQEEEKGEKEGGRRKGNGNLCEETEAQPTGKGFGESQPLRGLVPCMVHRTAHQSGKDSFSSRNIHTTTFEQHRLGSLSVCGWIT